MKKILVRLSFVFVLALFLNACCTKMKCSYYAEDYIELVGFQYSDLDTIYVTYNSETEPMYIQIEDSLKCTAYFNSFRISKDQDFTIHIPSVGKTYKFHDFDTKKERCNTGFMCRDFEHPIVSYKVNSTRYNLEDYAITIHKD